LKPVGIIANPASGKDIRRLVAYGSVFDNNEKTNIVRRLLMAMDSVGVRDVFFMPDGFHIGPRAIDDLEVRLRAELLDMPVTGTQDDSMRAAEMMADMGMACIVTLGGDGTNRVVAKTCGDVPLVPISTGTNNVFPFMVEGTLAGLAAGVIAANSVPVGEVTHRAPRLELCRNGECIDIALIDIVVSSSRFTAARAIWDPSTIHEIFLTRADPGNIGFSSIGGHLHAVPLKPRQALHITLGPGKYRVKAPIAPGLLCWVDVESWRVFDVDAEIPVAHMPSLIALDGEREIALAEHDHVGVRINPKGPLVVHVHEVLKGACQGSLFVCDQEAKGGNHDV
jgi:predicted polyphosphate/ATP-dependent NAD kinase